MPKDRFSRNPYPDVRVSDEEREHLIDLVNGCVQNHFQKYDEFVVTDKHQVDERRWEHVKSKDDMHVYTERVTKDSARKTGAEKDMASMLTVGTIVGDLEDLMFGIMNTTRDAMRVKTAYVCDIDNGAILCPVVEPTEDEPYRTLVVKWMTTDSSSKSRDFVCIEATDILQLENGERVGYHVLHSIEFPQTKPLPTMIRGNVSSVNFFRPIHRTIIDNFGSSFVDPGVKAMRRLFISNTAKTLLTATNYVRCGQMKKLAWMLQRRQASFKLRDEMQHSRECVMCGRHKSIPGIKKSTCKLCRGRVCYTCKVREQMSFISQEGELVQHKITFCSQCMSKAINCSTQEAARDQAMSYRSCGSSSTYSETTILGSTFADSSYSASSMSESSFYQ
ncbi:Zinc finger, RING/FYVE/PHD-type [Phytophthora cinnamomi]|uniref:Zinc finger, RING/FYVE/PHD-type n=1 Tax=Phytophthora cinnamomi TaxID=4785 RepID=UPI00355A3213|nr:Zinc finger, RING/FYVE/PHD-type [Phytophthora cinnamomi]